MDSHTFSHIHSHTPSPPTPTQWCTWCLGAEALLLPTDVVISRWPNWETSQLCSFGEITFAVSLLFDHLLYSSLCSLLLFTESIVKNFTMIIQLHTQHTLSLMITHKTQCFNLTYRFGCIQVKTTMEINEFTFWTIRLIDLLAILRT